ncbi:hypothetical protein MBLNU230_g8587t1 [Neophaeotheca triangularis]
MAIKGGLARITMMSCYGIIWCSSIIITAAFAWFTATQISKRNIGSLALGCASLLWSSISFFLICCTAGISFFAIPRIAIDILFVGVMMAVAIVNRSATEGCSSPAYPRVVYDGSGSSGCRLFMAAFAVAVLSVILYIVTAVMQTLIWRRGRSSSSSSKV